MVIDDSYTYENWVSVVKQKADDYSTQIQALQVDAIAFQFMYSVCISPIRLHIYVN